MQIFLHFLVFSHKHFQNNPKHHQNNLKPTKNQSCGELGFFYSSSSLLHFFFLSSSLYLNKWNLEMENNTPKKMAFFSSNKCPSSHFAKRNLPSFKDKFWSYLVCYKAMFGFTSFYLYFGPCILVLQFLFICKSTYSNSIITHNLLA